jgi:membrane protein DedA with SNARE-associated domain
MPGFRTPIFFSAGTLHLPFRVFLFYDGLAALISVPTIVFVTYFFGNHVDKVVRVVKRVQFGVIGTILLIVAVIVIKSWWSHKKELELVEDEEI